VRSETSCEVRPQKDRLFERRKVLAAVGFVEVQQHIEAAFHPATRADKLW
jgi:hypothetical protein